MCNTSSYSNVLLALVNGQWSGIASTSGETVSTTLFFIGKFITDLNESQFSSFVNYGDFSLLIIITVIYDYILLNINTLL